MLSYQYRAVLYGRLFEQALGRFMTDIREIEYRLLNVRQAML